ncbi:MAG: hypothetical protein KC468_34965, partial [Myxococcales bacterium]|nr:hypothetical protein [Myxococcales bacterium]
MKTTQLMALMAAGLMFAPMTLIAGCGDSKSETTAGQVDDDDDDDDESTTSSTPTSAGDGDGDG